MHQRAGDQQPPAHAAGQLVDLGVAALAQVGDLQGALDGVAALGAGDAVEVREDLEVLSHRERRVEVVELRDHAALGAGLLALAGQPVPEHGDLALVGDRLGGEHAHRGGLARAVGAEQADAGAEGHVEVQAGHGRDVPEALDDAPELYRKVHKVTV